ncbi:TPA: hypothetical protein RSV18_002119 [Pseudomonas aeruginosa]|nr:hypothetical protein [Pseudomonas aeruginosa]
MSEVKKISPVGNIYGWEEGQFGEFVLSEDYDALAAEAQALREQVAALRARVVVVPERLKSADSISRMLREIGYDGDVNYHHACEIWNACLDELARLNGLTVSEGLLRRLLDSDGIDGIFDAQQNYAAHQELRALLSEQEGGKP